MPLQKHLLYATSGALTASMFACTLVSDPITTVYSDELIAASSAASEDALAIFDAASGARVATIPLEGDVQSLVYAPGLKVVLVGSASSVRVGLAAFDASTGQAQWRMGLPTMVRSQGDGAPIELRAAEPIAAAHTGNRVYVAGAWSSGVQGVARLSADGQWSDRFSGPWTVRSEGLVIVPPQVADSRERVALLATRGHTEAVRPATNLYLLDDALGVIDSVTPAQVDSRDLWEVRASPDGTSLYIAGSEYIARYDIRTRAIAARVRRPATGSLTVVNDSTVVVGDVGSWPDAPGSGLLYAFSDALEPQGTVDISTPLGGVPHTSTASVSGLGVADGSGDRIYVSVGTEAVGPLYPPQPSRILLVDMAKRRVERVIDIGGSGRRHLALVPE